MWHSGRSRQPCCSSGRSVGPGGGASTSPRDIIRRPVGAQALNDGGELGPIDMLANEGLEGTPCEGKQRLVHERERRRGPLDVEDDRVEAARAEVERHTDAGGAVGRIYAGPKHTGWKSRSAPLWV